MIHSFSKRYIVQSITRTNTIDIWNEPKTHQVCNMCTSWQHEFNASRKWPQSKKRVLKTNESFIVTLYIRLFVSLFRLVPFVARLFPLFACSCSSSFVYYIWLFANSHYSVSLDLIWLPRNKFTLSYGPDGRAIAEAVSRWLPTAAARVQSRVWSSGICGGQSGVGAGFLRVLRFPLPFIPPNSPSLQSPGAGTIGQ
jgi:hypothetical protein